MVARNDGEHYGRLVLYRFPKQSLVYGPTQIVNRINQDTDISRQISLWDQRGSEVIRGHLLDRKSTRLNSSHLVISYAVFCLKKKKPPLFDPSGVTSGRALHEYLIAT